MLSTVCSRPLGEPKCSEASKIPMPMPFVSFLTGFCRARASGESASVKARKTAI
jgi:hypothetical protein